MEAGNDLRLWRRFALYRTTLDKRFEQQQNDQLSEYSLCWNEQVKV